MMMKITRTSLVIYFTLITAVVSPSAYSALLYTEDFESNQLGSEAKLSCDNSSQKFSVQSNTVRNGRYAALLENDIDMGKRCEVVPGKKNGGDFMWGQEYWVGYSFNIPHNKANAGWRAFHQHHSARGNNTCASTGGNGFGIFQQGEELVIFLTPPDQLNKPAGSSAAGNQSVAHRFPLETKKWFDVVMNFRYSDKADGFWKIWLNGKLIINKTGSNVNLYDKCGTYKARWYVMKYGIYSGIQGNGAVHYDELRIGDAASNYQEVAPSGTNTGGATTTSPSIYWVDNNGTASWAQSQSKIPLSGSMATSLATANANAKAGDLIYLRDGRYNTAIIPKNSGTKTSPITFKRYSNESATFDGLSRCIELSNKHYVIIDGISCFRTTGAWAEIKDGSSYNEIKNSHFDTAFNYTGMGITTDAHHNKIQANSFNATCSRTTPCPGDGSGKGSCFTEGGPGDSIYMTGNNNLIIDNDFLQGGTHYAITSKGSYNIFKHNKFRNTWHGNLGLVGAALKQRNIIEGNTFLDAGIDKDRNFCGQERDRNMPPNKQNQYGASYIQNTIIRGNVFINGGKINTSNWRGDILNQRVYNNTLYRNVINYKLEGSSSDYRYDNEIFMNNISTQALEANVLTSGPAASGNSLCNNNIWSTTANTKALGSNSSCNNSNISVDPQFISNSIATSDVDLHLKTNSPMIDAGAWLTTITSNTGTGRSFKVADAGFFMDGHGVTHGDNIQLETQTGTTRIIRVDYATNTLSVDKTMAWDKGMGVALPYSGRKPDLGAYEYTGTAPPPVAPVNTTINDDFSNNDSLNNFTAVSGGNWVINAATVEVTNPVKADPLGNILIHRNAFSGNFTLTVDATLLAPTLSFGDFAVILNYQDASNYYFVSFSQTNGPSTHGIFRVLDGEKIQLLDFDSGLISPETSYSIKLIKIENNIHAYQNETFLGSVSDTHFNTGKIGLASYNDSVSFDNLFVTENTQANPGTGGGTVNTTIPNIKSVEEITQNGHHYQRVHLQGALPLNTSLWEISNTTEFTQRLLHRRLQHHDALIIPLGVLKPEHSYWVRVRYVDRIGNLSAWSTPFQFTTPLDANDTDSNNVDDRYQVDSPIDIFDNGTLVEPATLCHLYDAQTNNVIGFSTNTGDMNCHSAYNKPQLLEVTDRILPYGLFNFKINQLATDLNNPTQVEVKIYFPSALETRMQWLTFDESQNIFRNAGNQSQLTGNSITLRLFDGGINDADGEVNGVIINTSGPSPKLSLPALANDLLADDSGGGTLGLGLFISILLFKLHYLRLLVLGKQRRQ